MRKRAKDDEIPLEAVEILEAVGRRCRLPAWILLERTEWMTARRREAVVALWNDEAPQFIYVAF